MKEFYYKNGMSITQIPKDTEVLFLDKYVTSFPTEEAFYLDNLKEYIVDPDNDVFKSINGILYNKKETILYSYPAKCKIKKYIVPESIEMICNSAFSGTIDELILNKNLRYIEEDAFRYSTIIKLHIDDINKYCEINFFNYYSSPFVSNPDLFIEGDEYSTNTIRISAKVIPEYSFSGAESLEFVEINNCSSIGYEAFRNCDLTVVQLNSFEKLAIENFAFADNDNLSFISKVNSLCVGEKTFKKLNYLEAKVNSIVFVPETFNSELKIKKFGVLKNDNTEMYVLPECTPELILEIYKEEVK